VSTSLKLSGGSVKEMSMYVTGQLDTEIAVRLDVKADGSLETTRTEDGWSEPQHVEMRVFKFPRARFFQMAGFVPVWEALEVSLVLRCDFAFKGEMHGTVGLHATGFVGAGGEYTKEGGLHALHEGPRFVMTPIWNVQSAGSVATKCSLSPEAAFFVYDLAGPTVSFGPYLEARIDHDPTTTRWSLQPGLRGDIGARAEVLGFSFFDQSVPIFDAPIGPPLTGTF
jgi:hypothetical protein